jgi:hypothetical protein
LPADVQVNGFTTGSQRVSSVAVDGNGQLRRRVDQRRAVARTGRTTRRWYVASTRAAYLSAATSSRTHTRLAPQYHTQVAADGTGNFVVVWNSLGQDGASAGVFARRFDAAGCPSAAKLQVNAVTTGAQNRPSVAVDAAGEFVIVWDTFDYNRPATTSSAGATTARLFVPLGGEFQVNTTTAGNRLNAAVAMTAGGSFVVVWVGSHGDH